MSETKVANETGEVSEPLNIPEPPTESMYTECKFEPSITSSHPENATVKEERTGFDSIQDVIYESMRETRMINETVLNEKNNHLSSTNLFLDTVEDIRYVANSAFATIQEWSNKVSPKNIDKADDFDRSSEQENMPRRQLLEDLTWPFAACRVSTNNDRNMKVGPQLIKIKEAVSRAVGSSDGLNATAHDLWKFEADSCEDTNTVGTFDTLQEENNQIRRLGSWGTIQTAGTSGTSSTDLNSLEPSVRDINGIVEDDDGNAIDPVLYEKTQRNREKRSSRREKVVKFEYPPITSLRQCPRPDPEDLPNLFFTEQELDQIEDDRYSTMSTDDIEIVAVSSKGNDTPTSPSRLSQYKSPRAALHSSSSESQERDLPETQDDGSEETGWSKTRGRSSSPFPRKHHEDNEEADFPTHESKSKSPTNRGRLVKGVQIYLRERSTGV